MIAKWYCEEQQACDEIHEKLNPIAKISVRSINRWIKDMGIMRERGDAYRLAGRRGRIHWATKDPSLKVSRNRIIPNKIRYFVLKRDNFRCVKCGNTASDCPLEVDHIQARCNGGSTVPENLQTLCTFCNQGKRIVESER
jgi:5-methylcytosine-specific restriction endonuclease McrA